MIGAVLRVLYGLLRRAGHLADQIVFDDVGVGLPLRGDGQVLRGHGRGNLPVPSGKGVAHTGRVCGCGDVRAVALRDGGDRRAAAGLKRDGVLPDAPLRVERDRSVGFRRQIADLRLIGVGRAVTVRGGVPAVEGVARFVEGVSRQRSRNVVGKALVRHLARAAVRVEPDGIGIRRPLRGDGHVRVGHGEPAVLHRRAAHAPAGEGVALLREGRIQRHLGAVGRRRAAQLGVAVLVDHIVPLRRPHRGIAEVLRGHHGDRLRIPHIGVAGPARHGHGDGRAVVDLTAGVGARRRAARKVPCKGVPVAAVAQAHDHVLFDSDIRLGKLRVAVDAVDGAARIGEALLIFLESVQRSRAVHLSEGGPRRVRAVRIAAVQAHVVVLHGVVDPTRAPLGVEGHIARGHRRQRVAVRVRALVPAEEGVVRARSRVARERLPELERPLRRAGELAAVGVKGHVVAHAVVIQPEHERAARRDRAAGR